MMEKSSVFLWKIEKKKEKGRKFKPIQILSWTCSNVSILASESIRFNCPDRVTSPGR